MQQWYACVITVPWQFTLFHLHSWSCVVFAYELSPYLRSVAKILNDLSLSLTNQMAHKWKEWWDRICAKRKSNSMSGVSSAATHIQVYAYRDFPANNGQRSIDSSARFAKVFGMSPRCPNIGWRSRFSHTIWCCRFSVTITRIDLLYRETPVRPWLVQDQIGRNKTHTHTQHRKISLTFPVGTRHLAEWFLCSLSANKIAAPTVCHVGPTIFLYKEICC